MTMPDALPAVPSLPPAQPTAKPPTHRIGATVSVFATLAGSDVKLAVWRRRLPSEVEARLREWSALDRATVEIQFRRGVPDVSVLVRDLADESARQWVGSDIRRLADELLQRSPASTHRLTFGRVLTDHCRKFHVDSVPLRLITTYLGPGTEWVPDSAVRWDAFGRPEACPERANRDIVKTRRFVRRARAGDVLMMKGASGFTRQAGQVHRSPPIERTARARIVLVISAC